MSRATRPFALGMSGLILVFVGLAFVSTESAEAQCGSQASSCKNCHEVQGQDPVNAKGDWHTQHAFGDFCAFCHAGNVQAADADAAHAGMVEPLSDVQAGCAACHPEDALELGTLYGAALGVEVGIGGGSPPGGASPGGGADSAAGPLGESEAPPAIVPPAAASDLLYRLSRLDPDLVRQVRGLDPETRALLAAISGI